MSAQNFKAYIAYSHPVRCAGEKIGSKMLLGSKWTLQHVELVLIPPHSAEIDSMVLSQGLSVFRGTACMVQGVKSFSTDFDFSTGFPCGLRQLISPDIVLNFYSL